MADRTEFDQITEEYIQAIRDHQLAHVEAIDSDDEAVNEKYRAAWTRVEEVGNRWRATFAPAN